MTGREKDEGALPGGKLRPLNFLSLLLFLHLLQDGLDILWREFIFLVQQVWRLWLVFHV